MSEFVLNQQKENIPHFPQKIPINEKYEQELAKLRSDIDSIDFKIVNLINKRLMVGEKIGRIKNISKSKFFDKTREKKVLKRIANANIGPINNDLLKKIFNIIITATKQIQKTKSLF